jgi:putative ABC transport system permease protein
MTKLFGVPMQDIMVTLLVITAVCLSSVAFVAWRNRTMFWLGVRNIPRRKAQTTLIVFGLMLATVIITSALAIGDTLAYSIKSEVYKLAGPIDLVVVKGQGERGRVARLEGPAGYFDRATYEALRGKVGSEASIDGLAPALVTMAPVLNQSAKQSEPVATILGIEPADAAAFGGVIAREGGAIDLAALGADELVVNASLAESLGAKPGDVVAIFTPQGPREFRVAQVARDGGLGGYSNQVKGAIILPAARAQALAGPEAAGKYNQVLVSARGDAEGGLRHEAAAADALRGAVAGTGLAVQPFKRQAIDQAELLGNTFTSFFLIFGLFAIAAGVLLIFLIFVMLAAERRGEMGMARAVGTKRRHLIQAFVAEGAAYDILAAAVGTGLGVAVAFGIVSAMARLLGNEEVSITPHVELRSLVVAYCLGVVVTFITIVISSWRVSRLNIVAAIRDLEDAKKPGGGWRGLAFGIAGVALGGFMWANAGTSAAPFSFGVSLAILASTLILRRLRLPGRLVYSLAGAALTVFWALPAEQSNRLFGKHEGSIEMFFIAGIMMVAGAILLLINNTEIILALTNAVGSVARRLIPSLRMGTAYPLASRFRTGLTMYMFALIIFVLVVMAAIQVNFDKVFNDPVKSTGGWDVAGQTLPETAPQGGAAGLRGALASGGVNVGEIAAIGGAARVEASQARLQTIGGSRGAGGYPVNGVDDGWLAATQYHLQSRAEGYADDAAVWRAVRENPNLVVIDFFAFPGNNAGTDDVGEWKVEGIPNTGRPFAPRQVTLTSPTTGQARTVTIIGVTDTFIAGNFGMFANQRLVDEVFGPQPVTSYFFKLQPGIDDRAMARAIEAAMLQSGMQTQSIHEFVAENNRANAGFFSLLKGFIGLGLVVGIAALGVVAFRAVVERRQQIGMLRAIGFGRGMVTAAFLIESLFITTLGIIAGVATSVVLARNLFADGEFGATDGISFIVPWDQIALFAGVALVAALLMTIVPSRQAGNVLPAEALRYE